MPPCMEFMAISSLFFQFHNATSMVSILNRFQLNWQISDLVSPFADFSPKKRITGLRERLGRCFLSYPWLHLYPHKGFWRQILPLLKLPKLQDSNILMEVPILQETKSLLPTKSPSKSFTLWRHPQSMCLESPFRLTRLHSLVCNCRSLEILPFTLSFSRWTALPNACNQHIGHCEVANSPQSS